MGMGMGIGKSMTLHNLAPLPMVNSWLKKSLAAVAAGLLGVGGLALGAQSRAQSLPLLQSVPKTPATPALTAPAGQPLQHHNHHHHQDHQDQNNNNQHHHNGHKDHKDHNGHNGHNHEVGPAGRSYDLRWLDAMVQHHTGALRMSEYVFDIGVPGVGALAKEIWRDQAQEIKAMGQWRKAWYPEAPVYPVALAPGGDPDTMAGLVRMSEAQIAAMRMMESTPNRDNRVPWFLEGMLQHHGGALLMAHDALAKSRNPDLRRLAAAIIVAQRREIIQLRRMLNHDGLNKPEYYRYDALFSPS
jgi:uncharacterized protein (DUF305 family)